MRDKKRYEKIISRIFLGLVNNVKKNEDYPRIEEQANTLPSSMIQLTVGRRPREVVERRSIDYFFFFARNHEWYVRRLRRGLPVVPTRIAVAGRRTRAIANSTCDGAYSTGGAYRIASASAEQRCSRPTRTSRRLPIES